MTVSVHPSGPLYAGTTSVTFDCTFLLISDPPPPAILPVETQRLNNDGCERVAMLTCIATVVDNFAISPNITWLDSENQVVQSGSNDVMFGGPGELIFNDVTQNNMGSYKCRACVTIEEVGIVDLCSSSVVTVSNTGMARGGESIIK